MNNKVNLEVFEEFGEAIGFTDDINKLVYKMCTEFEDVSDQIEGWCGLSWSDDAWDKFQDEFEAKLTTEGYKYLDGDTSGEGGGEYCYGVFELKGKTYKAEYAYYSHNGHEYDGIEDTLREVTPVQKTITVWE